MTSSEPSSISVSPIYAATARQIWKFQIPLATDPVVKMPQGAQPLHFADQDGQPTLWALVTPDNPEEARQFHLYGTGNPIAVTGEGLTYIGTCFQGPFVWHLFEPSVKEAP